MLQSSKTSPQGRRACSSVICWEKGSGSSADFPGSKLKNKRCSSSGHISHLVLHIRPRLPPSSHLNIKGPLKSIASESCGAFLSSMAIYFFHLQMQIQMVLLPTTCPTATGTLRTFSQRCADPSLVFRFSRFNSVNITRLIFMLSLHRRWTSCTLWFTFRWDNKHKASNVGSLGLKK